MRRPPRITPTYTLFPYTTFVRSREGRGLQRAAGGGSVQQLPGWRRIAAWMGEPVFGVGIDDEAALAGEDDDLAAIAEAEAFRLQLPRRALAADRRIARRRAFLQIDCGGFGGDFETVDRKRVW